MEESSALRDFRTKRRLWKIVLPCVILGLRFWKILLPCVILGLSDDCERS